MYQIIEEGTEHDIFMDEVRDAVVEAISWRISETLKKNNHDKSKKCGIKGAFVIHDTPLRDGGTTNLWVSYSGRFLGDGIIDMGIRELVTFDVMPDFLLDKYRKIQKGIKKIKKTMEETLTPENVHKYFDTKVRDKMFNTIAYIIRQKVRDNKGEKEVILGGTALGNVPLISGEIVNVWIEFNVRLERSDIIEECGIFDAGIHKIIIYDGTIPDSVLDSYNNIKVEIEKHK